MSVYRYQLADHSAELTLIDAESKSVEDARAVLEWQFGPRVVSVRQVIAQTLEPVSQEVMPE